MKSDDEEFNRLKREFLALYGISSEAADRLEVAAVQRNKNGSFTVSYVAKDCCIAWSDFSTNKG